MPKTVRQELLEALPERVDYDALIPRIVVNEPLAVVSDWHVPYIDEKLFEQFVQAIQRHGVKKILVVGDTTHQDAFSKHPPGMAGMKSTPADEFVATEKVLDILFRDVHHIIICGGNHDIRLLAKTDRGLTLADLYRMIYPKAAPFVQNTGTFEGDDGKKRTLEITELPTIRATIFGQEWEFYHPDEYSRIRGRVPTNFAKVHHKNIGVGHTHSFGMAWDESGKFMALELGGLFDARYFGYLYEKPRSAPRMTPGFFVFDEGGAVVPYPGRARGETG